MFETIVDIVFYVSGVVVATIQIGWDLKEEVPISFGNNIQVSPSRKKWTREGRWLHVFIAIAAITGIVKIHLDHKSSDNLKEGLRILSVAHANDSTQKIIDDKDRKLAQIQGEKQMQAVKSGVDTVNSKLTVKTFQFDTLSKALRISQQETKISQQRNEMMQKEFNSPVFSDAARGDEINPLLTNDSTNHRYVLSVNFTNIGKGLAKCVSIRSYILIALNEHDFIIEAATKGEYDDTSKSFQEGGIVFYALSFNHNEHKKKYLCVEMRYKNAFKEDKPPLRCVYLYDPNYINQHIPVVKMELKRNITDYLVKNGYWK